MSQVYRLLALCARAEGHPAFHAELARLVGEFTAWNDLPAQAELHGIAPLLWHHFQQSGLPMPPPTQRALRALYLRHRSLNREYTLVLKEILTRFDQAGMHPLVLKGLAFAYQYYSDPALRPISDIDLLFDKDEVLPALNILAEAGFCVKFPDPNLELLPKELTADSPPHNGITAHIEIHHYDPAHRSLSDNKPDNEFADFCEPPNTLLIDGCTVFTPSPLDTLLYLDRHQLRHFQGARSDRPLPLKWSADILNLVEQHAETLDWNLVRKKSPALLRRLAVFYSLTPMPDRYKNIIPVRQIQPPGGPGQYPSGWPQQPFRTWKTAGFWRYVWQTFNPPNWWLSLCYGIDQHTPFGYGKFVYCVHILKLMILAFIRRVQAQIR